MSYKLELKGAQWGSVHIWPTRVFENIEPVLRNREVAHKNADWLASPENSGGLAMLGSHSRLV